MTSVEWRQATQAARTVCKAALVNLPKMYTKPFTVKVTHLLQPDTDILEYVCAENESDRTHLRLK